MEKIAGHLLPFLCNTEHRILSRQTTASHLFSYSISRCFLIPVGFSQVLPLFHCWRVSSSVSVRGGMQSVEYVDIFLN